MDSTIILDEDNIFDTNNREITGDTINTTSKLFLWISIAVLVILIIWLIYQLFITIPIKGENYNQRQTAEYYNRIGGEQFDENAETALRYGNAIENPQAMDHYRMGVIELLLTRNHERAYRHFTDALNEIIEGRVDTRQAPYIFDRIFDYGENLVNIDVEYDLPLQRALDAMFQNQTTQLNGVKKIKKEIAKDDPEFIQKTILSRKDWVSDSQNVHDSAIRKELDEQVHIVMEENKSIPDVDIHDYDEFVKYIRDLYEQSTSKTDVEKVLARIKENYMTIVENVREKDLVTAVWQRSFDESNKSNGEQIRKALAEAVLDCVENGMCVCMSGRNPKIWQALVKLDKNPNIGILKTKQALRNEIFDRAAKVVNDAIGPDAPISQELRNSFNKDENTEQVRELKEYMSKNVDAIAEDYKDLLLPEQIQLAIAECKAGFL